MKGLIGGRNKEKWLEQLKKEEHDLKEECDKLEKQRSSLRERVGVLETMVEKFEKLAGQGGHLAGIRRTLAEQGEGELSSLKGNLSTWDNEWEEKNKRGEFLNNLVQYIKNSTYLE